MNFLRLQQHDGQQQQRQPRQRPPVRASADIETGSRFFVVHGVEAGRQRQDRRRAEQRHRLQERDHGAGDQRRQR